MTLWMEVTQDDLELPLIVAGSPQELAELAGTNVYCVYKSVSRRKTGEAQKGRFVKVEIESEGDEI